MAEPPLRILLIEDNPADARLVQEALRDSGHAFEVHWAKTLKEGLESLTAAPPQIILLDFSLPDARGLDLLDRVIAEAPDVPIVVQTGLSDEAVALEAVRRGAQDYLVKGHFDGRALSRTIHYARERREAQIRLRELQRLQEVDRLKTQLINLIAHELSTPLTPIELQVHLLASRPENLTDAQRKAVEIIRRNLERVTHLVREVIEAAGLDSMNHEQGIDLALQEFSQSLVAEFAPRFQAAGVRFQVDSMAGTFVRADPDRLRRALAALLQNGLRFTPKGGFVRLQAIQDADHAVLRVQDSGPGLTADQISRLFQPFAPVHDTMQRSEAGVGLGLYICRHLVESQGGTLWAESPGAGQGSTFSVRMPVGRPARTPPGPLKAR